MDEQLTLEEFAEDLTPPENLDRLLSSIPGMDTSGIEELADDAIVILNRILSKPEIRTCRIPLIIDFKKMKDVDYWLKCKIFDVIPSSKSATMKEKFELLTDLIMELEMMQKQVDPVYAEKFFKRMAACLKKKKYFPYEIFRADPDNLSIDKLWRKECQLTYELLINNDASIYGDWYIMKNSVNGFSRENRPSPFGFDLSDLAQEINYIGVTHIYDLILSEYSPSYIQNFLAERV